MGDKGEPGNPTMALRRLAYGGEDMGDLLKERVVRLSNGVLQAYVARELLKESERLSTRQACSPFGTCFENTTGDFNWLFGDGRAGFVLASQRHCPDARNFYLGVEQLADGNEGGPIFVNVNGAHQSIRIFPRGEIHFFRNPITAQRLYNLLTSDYETLHLFKAWKGERPDQPLDYLVFSRDAPDSAIYRPAYRTSIIIDRE